MRKVFLYQTQSTGALKVWSIWRIDATVYREWGLDGGATQTTAHDAKAIQQKSPTTVAIE